MRLPPKAMIILDVSNIYSNTIRTFDTEEKLNPHAASCHNSYFHLVHSVTEVIHVAATSRTITMTVATPGKG